MTWHMNQIPHTHGATMSMSPEIQETFLDWLPLASVLRWWLPGDLLGGWWPFLLKANDVLSDLTLKLHQTALFQVNIDMHRRLNSKSQNKETKAVDIVDYCTYINTRRKNNEITKHHVHTSRSYMTHPHTTTCVLFSQRIWQVIDWNMKTSNRCDWKLWKKTTTTNTTHKNFK